MTPKYMTFWKLVDALDKPTLISGVLGTDFSYELGHKPVATLQNAIQAKPHRYAAKVGPSLYAEYCRQHPVAINLWHAYRGAAWEFASVYALPDKCTLYRFWNRATSRADAQWQRRVALERYCCGNGTGCDDSVPVTLRSRLPVTVRKCITGSFAILDEDGNQTDCPIAYGDRLFAVNLISVANRCSERPALPRNEWWRPARIARSYASTLRRDLSPLGDFFVRAFYCYGHHGTSTDGWYAGVSVCSSAGDFAPAFVVNEKSEVASLVAQKDDILSWAANNVYIPGPSI